MSNAPTEESTQEDLLIAVKDGDVEEIRRLIDEHRADVNRSPDMRDRISFIHVAAKHGRCEVVRLLFGMGLSIESKCAEGRTALHFAVDCKSPAKSDACIKQLVSLGANFDVSDRWGLTPIALAVQLGRPLAIRTLAAAGANMRSVDYRGNNVFAIAVRNNCDSQLRETLRALVNSGAEIDMLMTMDETAVHIAAAIGSHDGIAALIELGADAEARNLSGHTPLYTAVTRNHPHIVRYLFEQHGSLVTRHDTTGQTPLHEAARQGNVTTVRLLLACGADIDARDNSGYTPVMAAAAAGNEAAVTLLLRMGAGVSAVSSEQESGLFIAAKVGHRFVRLFALYGADIHSTNFSDNPPLFAAAAEGKIDSMVALEEEGADMRSDKGYNGRTAMHAAAKNGQYECVTFLINRGASSSALDNDGSTPFMVAQRSGDVDIPRLLMAIGIGAIAAQTRN